MILLINWILENNDYVEPSDDILSEEVIGLEISGEEFRDDRGEDQIVVFEKCLYELQVRDLPKNVLIIPSSSEMIYGPVIEEGTVSSICRTEEGLECYIHHEMNEDYMYNSKIPPQEEIRLNKLKERLSQYKLTEKRIEVREDNSGGTTILIKGQMNYIGDILNKIEEDIFMKVEETSLEFSSEEEFTKSAVIPYLKSKNYNDIIYNHGPKEYGKDVIYSYIDELGDTSFGASLVKLNNISGSINGNLGEVIEQIEMAFEVPIELDNFSGEDIYIKKLLVICSGRVTANARRRIKNSDRINKHVRYIKYINGEEIFRGVKRF